MLMLVEQPDLLKLISSLLKRELSNGKLDADLARKSKEFIQAVDFNQPKCS